MDQPNRMTKDTSASGKVTNENKTSQNGMPDADANGQKKDNTQLMSSMFITNPGKGSLMQRMASPNVQTEKKGGPGSTFGNTLLTTMAGTGKNAAEMSMNSSQGSVMQTQRFHATHHSSPFRDSIVRGMVTGVGLLGK
jgi:alpha-ketoglutarate-dependent taurine dioxygenase